MDFKRIKRICLFYFVMALVIPSLLYSQQTKPAQPTSVPVKDEKKVKKSSFKRIHPREAYPPDQRPEENYLARFKAIEVSERLIKRNIENIYMLKVIVSNFKEQGWEKEYNDIYEEYKKAVSFFYRRQVIYSRLELEKNKKRISDLFKKIVDIYQDQTHAMLENCADKILDFSLDERNKFDPNRNRVLFRNMMRLWIAYGQIDDSDKSSIDNMFKTSVYHLRIAKAYAIQILEQLDPKGAIGQFKVHKADNLNRILTPETAKSVSPASESGPSTVK